MTREKLSWLFTFSVTLPVLMIIFESAQLSSYCRFGYDCKKWFRKMWDCCDFPCGSPTCHFPIKMAIFQLDFFEACTCASCWLPCFFQSKFFNQSFGDESAQYPKEFFHQRAAKMFSITLRISSGYQLTFQSDELLSVCQTVLLFKGLYVLLCSAVQADAENESLVGSKKKSGF